jgi:hypothetical protein
MPDAVVEKPAPPRQPTMVRNAGAQQLMICGSYLGPGKSFVVSGDGKTATFTRPDKTTVERPIEEAELRKLQRWAARGVLEAYGDALAMPADAPKPVEGMKLSDLNW